MPNGTSYREKTLPLSVANTAFLNDRMGEDCHPLQFLRELTQNSIESILRTPEKRGKIVWDVDWKYHADNAIYKLSVTDTGDGMTGPEMVQYINQLSSSISEQTFGGNYGVGAKIAAATRTDGQRRFLGASRSP
jgi:sensor histidine kinase regulating citrate/malate metabolism